MTTVKTFRFTPCGDMAASWSWHVFSNSTEVDCVFGYLLLVFRTVHAEIAKVCQYWSLCACTDLTSYAPNRSVMSTSTLRYEIASVFKTRCGYSFGRWFICLLQYSWFCRTKEWIFFFNQLSEVVDENLKEKVNTLENILTMQRLFS